MKFDAARAGALAETLSPEARSFSSAAEVLTASGYRVDRDKVDGPRSGALDVCRFSLPWSVVFLVYLLGCVTRFGKGQGLSPPARLGLMVIGPAWLIFGPPALAAFWRRFGNRDVSENVTARREAPTRPPVRVVFMAALDAPPSVIPGRFARVARAAVVVLGLAFAGFTLFLPRPASAPARHRVLEFVSGVGLAFEVAVLVDLLGRQRSRPVTGAADNRDGLATLIELARTWPRATDRRIETRFVAAGGQTLDLAGFRTLHDQLRHDGPGLPTLVIGLWSPGLGPPFHLATNGLEGDDAMASAAEGLWIPHEFADGRGLWPFGTGDPDFVAVIGSSGRATVGLESLGLAAQLATEIALRWARRETTAQEPDPNPGRARSSQNPG